MKLASFLSLSSLALPAALALSVPPSGGDAILRRQNPTPGCTNDQSRLCWDGTFDIDTNYYTSGPRTGHTAVYYLDISNITLSPDGFERQVLAINGSIPGPTIIANWGDTLEIHVTNSMQYNGTSIHWHGIRQGNSSISDGVNGVTECPLAPGDTKVYRFVAEQYGTTWYHSHFSAQYGDGVVGAIIINGPATAEYDVDLGTITLQEWYHQTIFNAAYAAERTGPPKPDNFLINGTNALFTDTTKGTRFQATFEQGKKYRLRFVNTAVDQFYRVSIDSHTFTVIQSDFVPITPYTTHWIGIAIGQRYDVVVEANQAIDNYWLRVQPQTSCSSNANNGSVTGFIHYDTAGTGLPTSTADPFTDSCNDETQLVPRVPITVDQSGFATNQSQIPVSAPAKVTVAGSSVFRWFINGNTMSIDFDNPTLLELSNGQTSFSSNENAIIMDEAGSTAYWIIQNQAAVAHPIHLHGHDFNIVSSGTGTFNASTATLTWNNPPRRDVAILPKSGYLFLAFKMDNPGVWLMHCHIAFHVAEGLSLQLVERRSEIFDHFTLDAAWQETCTNWDNFYPTSPYFPKTDSGLRLRM